jgi:hypothetical protein
VPATLCTWIPSTVIYPLDPIHLRCSDENSRSQCPYDYFPGTKNIGGFTFTGAEQQGNEQARAASWSSPKGAVYHISAGWESLQCLVTHVDNNTVYFDEAVGCDQGPQATNTGLLGWFVDNVKEECDSPGVYYLDSDEKALYYTFNATEQPTGDEDFSLTTTKVIFNVSGTQALVPGRCRYCTGIAFPLVHRMPTAPTHHIHSSTHDSIPSLHARIPSTRLHQTDHANPPLLIPAH